MTFRILTFNICHYPTSSFSRINTILEEILSERSSIICLQGVFDYSIQQKIAEYLEKHAYHIHFSTDKSKIIPKNGLLTASIFPITDRAEMDFNKAVGLEYFINKGVLTTTIEHPIYGICEIHNTDLQSDHKFCLKSTSTKCRDEQIYSLRTYINPIDPEKPHCLVGSLKTDYLTIRDKHFIAHLINHRVLFTQDKKNQTDYILGNFNDETSMYFETKENKMLVCDIYKNVI